MLMILQLLVHYDKRTTKGRETKEKRIAKAKDAWWTEARACRLTKWRNDEKDYWYDRNALLIYIKFNIYLILLKEK